MHAAVPRRKRRKRTSIGGKKGLREGKKKRSRRNKQKNWLQVRAHSPCPGREIRYRPGAKPELTVYGKKAKSFQWGEGEGVEGVGDGGGWGRGGGAGKGEGISPPLSKGPNNP